MMWSKFLKRFKEHFFLYTDFKHITLVAIGYSFLYFAYQISNDAGVMATRLASNSVSDTLHKILPKFNSLFLHETFSMAFYYSRNAIFLLFPRRVIFGTFTLATLILTRAFFINLTHIGMPEEARPIWSEATFGGDLFFSGHVAYAFLLALIFWDIKILRYIFIGISITLGASSVLGRYHYSIDVFAAPFIAYGIFSICKYIKKRASTLGGSLRH